MLPDTENHVLNNDNGLLKDLINWVKIFYPLSNYQ
mgnify:CR=1 FL=1